MINGLCVIQQGQRPDLQRDSLELALDALTRERLGGPLNLSWLVVDEGSGFTAGKPSTASGLSLTAAEALAQDDRESILRELVSLWTRETDSSIDDIVAVVADPQ